jgi:predicted transcriptional regulator
MARLPPGRFRWQCLLCNSTIYMVLCTMATKKMTFTLDEKTVARLNRAAGYLRIPKSQVVREAIGEYSANLGRLSEEERDRMLKVLDEALAAGPTRPREEVEQELRDIREARRGGGRRTSSEAP